MPSSRRARLFSRACLRTPKALKRAGVRGGAGILSLRSFPPSYLLNRIEEEGVG